MNRRELLKSTAAAAAGLWVAPKLALGQGAVRLADKIALIKSGGANLVAFNTGSGIVLVDSGAPNSAAQVQSSLNSFAAGAKVTTLFNTHYHSDITGNNEAFATDGAKILAQLRTRQYMATDYWVMEEDAYRKARPKAAWPTETFLTTGSLSMGGEQIDYGYLLMAHTSGDLYVHFKNANVIAVGDVASPERDPELDWFTGAWIGGRVDAMDTLLAIANDQTKIVPSYGQVMTKAQLKAERDVMEELRARLFKQVREGDGPEDMLKGGLMNGVGRTWKDPAKFLYAACKGLWGHHDKLDANVV